MLALLLGACFNAPEPAVRSPIVIVPGPPVAGMAEGTLDLPVGSPLGGYTGRCQCFGDDGEVDYRGLPPDFFSKSRAQ